MMKLITLIAVLFAASGALAAKAGGSLELVGDRMKIKHYINKADSKGAYALREVLEKAGYESHGGFNTDPGFVNTEETLAPLQLDNYLYADGTLAFNIYLPVDSDDVFVSYESHGFISFKGLAAQKLFDLIKNHLPRHGGLSNLEQYRFDESSYCDKTTSGELKYRCHIER